MKLLPVEEEEIFHWLKELDNWGLHMSTKLVIQRANNILEERQSDDRVGSGWLRHLEEQYPQLKTMLSVKQDVDRNCATQDPIRFNKFFNNAYEEAVAWESAGSVALAKQDFARLLPEAWECAFTRTNIVAGFEWAGIYPYNLNRFDFLKAYREKQDNPLPRLSSPLTPISDTNTKDLDDPSTPRRRERTNLLLQRVDNLIANPPTTPSKLIKALSDT
ncbi:Vacuolar protein sorting-associated protein atg6 [Marasmius sp. AFHP31]|nr:Vacuolar protein sorting-associated protein atg6 [Marasmius sp. AFHP31]